MDITPPEYRKKLQSFLDPINYLSKFSPVTAPVGELLREPVQNEVKVVLEQYIPRPI